MLINIFLILPTVAKVHFLCPLENVYNHFAANLFRSKFHQSRLSFVEDIFLKTFRSVFLGHSV